MNKKGFTLIELLAVIVILAVLMAIAYNDLKNDNVIQLKSSANGMTKPVKGGAVVTSGGSFTVTNIEPGTQSGE